MELKALVTEKSIKLARATRETWELLFNVEGCSVCARYTCKSSIPIDKMRRSILVPPRSSFCSEFFPLFIKRDSVKPDLSAINFSLPYSFFLFFFSTKLRVRTLIVDLRFLGRWKFLVRRIRLFFSLTHVGKKQHLNLFWYFCYESGLKKQTSW